MTVVTKSRSLRFTAFAFCLALGHAAAVVPASAAPGTTTGPAALALAALVSSTSSVHSSFDKRALARLFAGNSNVNFPPNRKISVNVDSIICRVSNVDITERSCELTFKTGKRMLRSREANELYGTLAVAGVTAEGAAGSMIESVMNLDCTVDPNVIKMKAGGGADCTFTAGQ
jgi:hypothetical protein